LDLSIFEQAAGASVGSARFGFVVQSRPISGSLVGKTAPVILGVS
jgi:hypothetical protein